MEYVTPSLVLLKIFMSWKLVKAIGCAFRGRYKEDGSTEQQLEINNEYANCLTAVQKDSMVIEVREKEE